MNILRETSLILLNAVLVTLAVVLGFTIGGALGIPAWLQGFCLVPAGYLYFRLSGGAPPAWWKMLGFLTVLSGMTFIFTVVFTHVPQHYQTVVFVLFIMFAPIAPVTRWLERRFAKTPPANTNSSSDLS
jgi:hypothetical protein